MPKAVTISTFKVFRHNFWTNEWSRFLYEGHYYPFRESDIGKIELIKKGPKSLLVKFVLPRAWLNEYRNGVYLSIKEFPKSISDLISKNDEAKAIEQVKRYFVKKIKITKKQAKVLLKLQFKDIPTKRLHSIHKRIGLS